MPNSTVAALFVDSSGVYANGAQATTWGCGLKPQVVAWGIDQDARKYAGPWPVVAHPPCQRWGRFWHGSTRKPHQYKLGADDGCFASALDSVRRWGGVLEHPCDSHAWGHFNLTKPKRGGSWQRADNTGGWTCYIEQGFYGHISRKPTWLYAYRTTLPKLRWGGWRTASTPNCACKTRL